MKNRLFIVIVVIAIAVATTTAVKVLQDVKTTIKIGMATTLTGRASTWGSNSRNGAVLAVEEINKAGGINGQAVELIIYDDKADPDVAIEVNRKLIAAGASAILGHALSTVAVKAVSVMNEEDRLMIAVGSLSPELTGLDDNLIRLMVPLDKEAPLTASLAYDRLGLRKMAVVYDLSNPNYTESYYRHFKKHYESLGGEISGSFGFDPRESFSAPEIAAQIANSQAEGLFVITNAIHGALICQHLRKSGSTMDIIASSWSFIDADFIQNGGRAVEGTVCITGFNRESSSESFVKFKKEYEQRFGEEISMAGQLGYESAHVLLGALAITEDPKLLKKTILDQKVFTSVGGGEITLDEFGDPARTMFVLEIHDGKIRTRGMIE